MSSMNEILLKHWREILSAHALQTQIPNCQNLGNFVEPGTTSLATLDEGTGGAGVDHWSWSGWVAAVVVLVTVIGLAVWFKKKVVE